MVYFSDYFNVDEQILEDYGAFNISLINDLPLFIDPFLLFGSDKSEYQQLHINIIEYLTFLKTKSEEGNITDANIKSWYKFSEVRQNWLGYSLVGNGGSGLGKQFGEAMSASMHIVYDDLNNERVTVSSHLEKAGLFQIGVGKDNISDFTCNLIKEYLAEYTEKFATEYLEPEQVKTIMVNKVYFDYELERWMPKQFSLPFINGDFVLLTPKDLLTKDDNWINSNDLKGSFESICNAIPNDQLRSEIHNYFRSKIPPKPNKKRPTQKELSFAINETIKKFPDILKYYIKSKEENKVGAKNISQKRVEEVEEVFINNVSTLIGELIEQTNFYAINPKGSFEEALERVEFLKDVIENKDGYKLFYSKGKAIKREADLQVIYRLTWHATPFDVNREVNNGRGPVDYTVSSGSEDKTLVEFKLASNSKLKMNLENQVGVYEAANNTSKSIKVIMYFDAIELAKVNKILKELKLENNLSIVLIDACDNKPSASNVK
uniref:Uncharacterized protein n=1 Tax=Roseihalotalea indica TaxID=2867963 RepID=A0AA49JJR0_9BACT|nr:hypothetical protein K4G66_14640 [Tunicatimonas sp. TK19036]